MEGGEGENLYHTVTSPKLAQSVLDGINPVFFDEESRFGGAFYMSEIPDTTLAELKFHDATGSHTLRYDFSKKASKILDLTNPRIARRWGYLGGKITDVTKSVGMKARDLNYNAIRYSSEQGEGANLAILDDFKKLLEPQMIVATPELESSSYELLNRSIFNFGS